MAAVHAAIGGGSIPVGAVLSFYGENQNLDWLLCDGTDTTGTEIELSSQYPDLYTYLGNTNILPDLRECTLVGAGKPGKEKNETYIFDSTELNPKTGTNGSQDHDVYQVREFKDDQFQGHQHRSDKPYCNDGAGRYGGMIGNGISSPSGYVYSNIISSDGTNGIPRFGKTTHGKQIGVYYYIKAR